MMFMAHNPFLFKRLYHIFVGRGLGRRHNIRDIVVENVVHGQELRLTLGLSRAGHRVGSRPWLGGIAELAVKIRLMFNVRLAGNELTLALQATHAEL
jgi:hypothetical protein